LAEFLILHRFPSLEGKVGRDEYRAVHFLPLETELFLDRPGRITRLLQEAHDGREGALDEVMELVYEDLRAIAGQQLRKRHGARSGERFLRPTELAHEGYLRLLRQRRPYDNRGQFFAVATKVMLRVLMDHDRAESASKRGGDRVRVTLSGLGDAVAPDPAGDIPAFVAALEKLEELDPDSANVVKLRVLWGLTHPEIARALDTPLRSIEREWQFARRWLVAELGLSA